MGIENSFFKKDPIYFGDYLTCIIGGKSMLLRQMVLATDADYVI